MEASKAELRRQFDGYRSSLDEETYQSLSQAAIMNLVKLPEIHSAKVVHTYWPMLECREIDTRPFIHWLKEHGKEIVLPVVLNFQRNEAGNQRLGHVRYTGEEGLRVNRWGIAEPVEHHSVPLDLIGAVVVPAFGADRHGHRIGFGYGYYDEFLAGITAPTVALVYDDCLIDQLPAEDHDRPVNVIVTESSIHRTVRT